MSYMEISLNSYGCMIHRAIDYELNEEQKKHYMSQSELLHPATWLINPEIKFDFSANGWEITWTVIVNNHFPELDIGEERVYRSAKKFILWMKDVHIDWLSSTLAIAEKYLDRQ